MASNEDKKRELEKKIAEGLRDAKPKPKRTTRKPAAPPAGNVTAGGNVIYVAGDGVASAGQIAGGDIHNHTTYNTEKVIRRPKVEVKTGDGVVSAEQKARLQQLVKDWVDTYNAVHVQKKTFGAAWKAVNTQVNVNSYHEIPADKFEVVEKWLMRQIAIKNSMPSAKKKSKAWRNGRIRGIQSRCNELGIQDKRKAYMLKTFGQESLTMLSDDDVDKVYRWVMEKK